MKCLYLLGQRAKTKIQLLIRYTVGVTEESDNADVSESESGDSVPVKSSIPGYIWYSE